MATINKSFRVKNGLVVEGAELRPAAGTSTYPPILLTSGTNLGTATAGAFEYDGTSFYLTASTGGRKTIAYTDSVLTSSVNLGTTSVALNRSSGALTLNGVSIDGNAGTVTNGVVTTGAYANPTWITGLAWSKITTTPTTLSGYGITDAATSTHSHGNITNAGAVGSTANLVLVTGASGVVTAASTPSSTTTQFLRGDLTWVVPTDTNFYPTAVTITAGTTAGPTVDLTMSGIGNITGSAIPSASGSNSGVVTTGAQTFAGVKTFNSFPQVASGLPTQALELVNKQYVDNVATGVNAHDAVVAATTAALTATYNNNTTGVGATLTNSGTQAALVIDNVSLQSGDRVLVKNQATTLQNGIYTVTTVGTVSTNWVLTRAGDYDQHVPGEVQAGDTTFVVAPAAQFSTTPTNQNTGWTMNSPGTITIGTSPITFVQGSGTGTITAGTGISVSGNQVSVDGTVLTTTSTQTGITNKTFVAPVLGAATATSINKVAITAPATSAILTIADGKTLTASNTLTFTGTDGSSLNIGTGGTLGTGAFATIANYVPTSTTVFGNQLNSNITGVGISGVTTITGTAGTTLAISLPSRSTAIGTNLTLTGGATTWSASVTNGGNVSIAGGSAAGGVGLGTTGGNVSIAGGNTATSDGVGGSITIAAGTGGAVNGTVGIGQSNTSAVSIGAAGITTTIAGTTATSTLTATTATINSIANIVAATGSTTGTTALTLSTLFNSSTYNGGEFTIKATNGSNIEITKVLVIANGTDIYISTYGDVFVSTDLVNIDFTYTSTNVNMTVTPVAGTTGTTSVRVTGTLLTV